MSLPTNACFLILQSEINIIKRKQCCGGVAYSWPYKLYICKYDKSPALSHQSKKENFPDFLLISVFTMNRNVLHGPCQISSYRKSLFNSWSDLIWIQHRCALDGWSSGQDGRSAEKAAASPQKSLPGAFAKEQRPWRIALQRNQLRGLERPKLKKSRPEF